MMMGTRDRLELASYSHPTDDDRMSTWGASWICSLWSYDEWPTSGELRHPW